MLSCLGNLTVSRVAGLTLGSACLYHAILWCWWLQEKLAECASANVSFPAPAAEAVFWVCVEAGEARLFTLKQWDYIIVSIGVDALEPSAIQFRVVVITDRRNFPVVDVILAPTVSNHAFGVVDRSGRHFL